MLAKKALVLSTLLVIIGIGIFVFVQQNQPTPAEILKAEQEIYALLLAKQRDAYNDATDEIQLVEFTNSGKFQLGVPVGGAGILQGGLELKLLTGLEGKTLLDFQKKNTASYPIKGYLPDSANVILVNPAAGKQLFWWVSFSRIGFNPLVTQALVLVGDCRGESCFDSTSSSMYSTGTFWLLEWENEEWIIKEGQDVWHIEAPAP